MNLVPNASVNYHVIIARDRFIAAPSAISLTEYARTIFPPNSIPANHLTFIQKTCCIHCPWPLDIDIYLYSTNSLNCLIIPREPRPKRVLGMECGTWNIRDHDQRFIPSSPPFVLHRKQKNPIVVSPSSQDRPKDYYSNSVRETKRMLRKHISRSKSIPVNAGSIFASPDSSATSSHNDNQECTGANFDQSDYGHSFSETASASSEYSRYDHIAIQNIIRPLPPPPLFNTNIDLEDFKLPPAYTTTRFLRRKSLSNGIGFGGMFSSSTHLSPEIPINDAASSSRSLFRRDKSINQETTCLDILSSRCTLQDSEHDSMLDDSQSTSGVAGGSETETCPANIEILAYF